MKRGIFIVWGIYIYVRNNFFCRTEYRALDSTSCLAGILCLYVFWPSTNRYGNHVDWYRRQKKGNVEGNEMEYMCRSCTTPMIVWYFTTGSVLHQVNVPEG